MTRRALEMRPNSRTFWNNAVLPAKWSVTIADHQQGILYVSINKVDKEVVEKRQFSYQQIQEIVDFLISHPFITCQWTFCKGIPSSDLVPPTNHLTNDHFGGMCIWRSVECKLLMSKEECTTDRCSYCANAASVANRSPMSFEFSVEPESEAKVTAGAVAAHEESVQIEGAMIFTSELRVVDTSARSMPSDRRTPSPSWPTTRDTLTNRARRPSRTCSSSSTGPCSSPTPGAARPRSSAAPAPGRATKSPTVKSCVFRRSRVNKKCETKSQGI